MHIFIPYHATAFKILVLVLKFFRRSRIMTNFCVIQQKLLPILCDPLQHLQKKLTVRETHNEILVLSSQKQFAHSDSFNIKLNEP